MAARRASSKAAARGMPAISVSVCAMRGPYVSDEDLAPCGLEHRDRVAQIMGAPHTRAVNSRREGFPFHAGEARHRRGALLRGQPHVSRNAAFGRLVKGAYRGRMKRVAAAVT